jgi:acetyl esterase/lipase
MANEALEAIIEMLRAGLPGPDTSLADLRAGYEAMTKDAPVPEDVAFEALPAGTVAGEWVRPAAAGGDRVVLYLHGGGYVLGSPGTHRNLVARVAAASGAHALALDYRLAPEHPFPAAVDDAVAAYRWLLAQDIAPGRLAIAGDSAGGGLTVATLVALRAAAVPLPAAAALLSPWTDLALAGPSMDARADADPMVGRVLLAKMADAYLHGADPKTPLASPLYADLTGLPPLYVQVGGREVLLDDATRLVARAREAGVDIALEQWDEMIHVWQAFAPHVPESDEAITRIGAYLRARWS